MLQRGHPIPGVTSDWHNLSHHGRNPEKIDQLKIIELAELHLLATSSPRSRARRRKAKPCSTGTMVLYGSNLGKGRATTRATCR